MARSVHSSVCYDNKVWIFGGENSNEKVTNTVYVYDINAKLSDNEWMLINNDQYNSIPNPRSGHTAVVWNGFMYVFGGNLGPKFGVSNDMWKYDLNGIYGKNAWSQIKYKGDIIPEKRTKHSCVVYKEFMILYGGWNETFETAYKDFYVISLDDSAQQNSNENKDNMDDGKNDENKNDNNQSNDIKAFTWYKVKIDGLPERIWHTCNIISNDNELKMVVVCGEDKSTYLQNDIFVLNCKNGNILDTKCWSVSKISDIPWGFKPRYGHISHFISMKKYENNSIQYNIIVNGGYAGDLGFLNDWWLITLEYHKNKYTIKTCKEFIPNKLAIKDKTKDSIPKKYGFSSNIVSFNNGKTTQHAIVQYGGQLMNFMRYDKINVFSIELNEWIKMKKIQKKNNKPNNTASLSKNEQQMIRQQLMDMGFDKNKIDNILPKCHNINHAMQLLFN